MIVTDWSKYPNFTKKEFDCQHTGKNFMTVEFMDKLQELRNRFKRVMKITSGYRDPSHPVEAKKANPGTQYTKEQFTKEVQEFHKDDSWIDREPFNILQNENGEIDFGSPTQEELATIELNKKISEAKAAKQLALDSITVEIDGMVFDGRDKDQGRMMAAIQASEILGTSKAEWRLADGTIKEITVDTLKLALAASIQEVGRIVKEL